MYNISAGRALQAVHAAFYQVGPISSDVTTNASSIKHYGADTLISGAERAYQLMQNNHYRKRHFNHALDPVAFNLHLYILVC